MVRQIFKNRVIAAAGPLPGQLTVDNLKRWTSMRKGAFSDNLDETVTHLLCTEEQFRKRAPRGRFLFPPSLKPCSPFHLILTEFQSKRLWGATEASTLSTMTGSNSPLLRRGVCRRRNTRCGIS